QRVTREVAVWGRLGHPHILPFLGLYTHGTFTYMVSPWMENGDALHYVQKNPHVDCLKLLIQIAEGVTYLHTLNPPVIHGDLKGANILISDVGDAYIGDFGLSQATSAEIQENSTAWSVAGHPRWQAPELIDPKDDGFSVRTAESDIFALGRLSLGRVPFEEITMPIQIAYRVMKGILPPQQIDDGFMTRGPNGRMWELMKWCWEMEPKRRPSALQFHAELCAVQEARYQQPGTVPHSIATRYFTA
ncbi:hypothetical protein BOTBODRAFT_110278, partial [Botryobasidium botryosum FD-172 SS1]